MLSPTFLNVKLIKRCRSGGCLPGYPLGVAACDTPDTIISHSGRVGKAPEDCKLFIDDSYSWKGQCIGQPDLPKREWPITILHMMPEARVAAPLTTDVA